MPRMGPFARAVYRLLRPVLGGSLEELRFRLAPERILGNHYVAAKILEPLLREQGFYVLSMPALASTASPQVIAVPSRELWEGYGDTEDQYLSLGRQHMDAMIASLRAVGASPERFSRVLDFGCAAGRMLRFYPRDEATAELWGVDIKANHIAWCQEHFGPPFFFAATTTFPHLPFGDGYFDMIYSGSVFTHIGDLADAWFLELRRILRPGGYLYITINDKHSIKLLFERYEDPREPTWFRGLTAFVDSIRRIDAKTAVLSRDYGCLCFEEGAWDGYPVPRVIYDVEYLTRKWSGLVTCRSVTREAYLYQTALLFQK